MSVEVKICGITRAEDAQAAVDAGADAIGLVFYPGSTRYVDIDIAQQIVKDLPPFVMIVGLFVDPDEQHLLEVCGAVPLNLLQMHGSESALQCERYPLPYIKALGVTNASTLSHQATSHPLARAILLDKFDPLAHGGTGQSFDWAQVPRLDRPMVLAGGLDVYNVEQGIRTLNPCAVDVSSGVESAPGFKDPEKIKRFIEVVKSIV